MAKHKVDWVEHSVHESGEIVAKVTTLPLREGARFSLLIGRRALEGERIQSFFPPEMIPDAISVLESIYAEHMAREDKRKSELQADLEKKADQRANYLANVERRKEENRARASAHTPGGKKQKKQ